MEVEMMSEDVDRLMATVSRAAGRELDPEVWEDRQIMNHGCQILNRIGYGPQFDYDTDIYGPFSFDLMDAFEGEGIVRPEDPCIETDHIEWLSELLSKGIDFLMAYNTLLEAYRLNARRSHRDVKDWIVGNEPVYKTHFDRAFDWIETHQETSSDDGQRRSDDREQNGVRRVQAHGRGLQGRQAHSVSQRMG